MHGMLSAALPVHMPYGHVQSALVQHRVWMPGVPLREQARTASSSSAGQTRQRGTSARSSSRQATRPRTLDAASLLPLLWPGLWPPAWSGLLWPLPAPS
jgi:hypothetical protein